MPATTSKFNPAAADATIVSNVPFLTIKTKKTGPAGPHPEDQPDIIDEAIALYRANVLMREMSTKGPADNLLVYLTLTISGTLLFRVLLFLCVRR